MASRSLLEIEMELASCVEKIHSRREAGQNWDDQIRRLQLLIRELNKATRGQDYKPGFHQRLNIKC